MDRTVEGAELQSVSELMQKRGSLELDISVKGAFQLHVAAPQLNGQ